MRFAWLSLLLCSCVASSPRAPVEKPSEDIEASIARVEHGLIPEVRVDGEKLAWSIEARLARYHTPAVSVAVIHHHRVLWARAWGVKDRRSGARADEETLFQAASISKMVTALAALRAVEAGRATVDGDINASLRSWKLPENELTRAHPVTLAELLTHTAGTNVHSMHGYARDSKLPTLEQILDGKPPATTAAVRVEYPPGKEFHYSGGGATVVQQLVVDAAGRPFPDAMAQSVFAPLGLTRSTFELPMPPAARAAAALAHDYDESLLPEIVNPESAAAGLWTTPREIAQFLVAIQLALDGRPSPVSPRIAKWMTTPVAPIGVPDVWTGMGTFVEKHRGATWFGHDGLNDGFLAMSRASLRGGEGAVVMANGAAAAPLIFEIMRAIAAEYSWEGWLAPPIRAVHLNSERLNAVSGHFTEGPDKPVTVAVKGDRLELREPFKEPLELIPISNDRFVSREDVHYEFRENGEWVKTANNEPSITLKRAKEGEADPLALLEAGRDDDALARYRAIQAKSATDPLIAEARFDDLASELCDRRLDFASAIRVFRVEAALYPGSAYANAGLALAYFRAGRRAEALPYRERALALLGKDRVRDEMEQIYLGIRIARIKQY